LCGSIQKTIWQSCQLVVKENERPNKSLD